MGVRHDADAVVADPVMGRQVAVPRLLLPVNPHAHGARRWSVDRFNAGDLQRVPRKEFRVEPVLALRML